MKKKILLLSDDLRTTSGVGTMSKEIVLGTIHKYDWVQLGGAINHPEAGKIVDINEDVRERTGVKDANLKVIPNNGYGNIFTLRMLLEVEKPDAIIHFTDPHYWQWLYDAEHEIRQQIPILYYHVWDNLPDPLFNRDIYESCDWIGCISKQTYGLVKRVGSIDTEESYQPLKDWQVSYVPHGINPEVFKPVDTLSEELGKHIYNNKEYDFILFFNNRNIKRKQPGDVILSYKLFCDSLSKEEAERCLLLMHTTPIDENGTDLTAVAKSVCPDYDIKFINIKLEQEKLNELYNTVDCTINISNNEGFGLGTAESVMAGTPIIVNVTGGLQDQCGFNYTAEDYVTFGSLHDKKTHGSTKHGEWVVPVWSDVNNLNGSVPTPYIYEDRVNNYMVADAIGQVYSWGREERKRRGLIGREWAMKNLSNKVMCDGIIDGIETTFKNYKPRKRFDLYKIV
jgi:glycosyltransferase involved in cell wall biosynthesis